MSQTNHADVITVAPKSTGFTSLQSEETVDDEVRKRNTDSPKQDCLLACCLEVCTEPCAQLCAELIRFWCCLRCCADLFGSSSSDSSECCCCCDGCSGDECCGDCDACGDLCGGCGDICTCCCEG